MVISCDTEARLDGRDWLYCQRVLWSMTGLGGIVCMCTIYNVVIGIVPKKYMTRRNVELRRLATVQLSVEEVRR